MGEGSIVRDLRMRVFILCSVLSCNIPVFTSNFSLTLLKVALHWPQQSFTTTRQCKMFQDVRVGVGIQLSAGQVQRQQCNISLTLSNVSLEHVSVSVSFNFCFSFLITAMLMFLWRRANVRNLSLSFYNEQKLAANTRMSACKHIL